MKYLLKTALCLLLCALLSLPAFAEEGEEMEERICGDYIYVLLEDGGARITGYDGEDAELTVPDELDGHPVREIGEHAFFRSSLTAVTLPDSLTSIGGNSFDMGCSSLAKFDVSPDHPVFAQIDGVLYEKATKTLIRYPAGKAGDSFAVPDGILAIGDYAFYWCGSLTTVTLPEGLTSIGDRAFSSCDALTTITLPESLTSIGDDAFSSCALTTITLPDSLTSIGDSAFFVCSDLTTITLPDGLTSIGDEVFSSCRSLTSVTLPDSLTSIGANPFCSCDSLAKIDVSPDHPVFAYIDGVLYEKATKTLVCYPAGKAGDSFTVPDGTLAIGDYAFYGCDALTTVTLPDSLTSIGDGAFDGCSSLTTISLPDSLTTIGDGAFFSCDSLTTVTLPDGLTTIGDNAFNGCSSLTAVTLPDSLTSIGDRAFSDCDALTTVTLPEGLTTIGDDAFSWCSSLTLTVPRDSYALQYAIDNGLSYTYPDANDWLNA